ncbi:hypothetical protein [Leptolyngbya sp. ST-U4]|uniref:hypothetical protein n=1 Tax=Leptolyngbya sp. ST-U4 TaxID=2933912 RepID=UPI0032979CA0
MSSAQKYSDEVRLALREGKGEINEHYRNFLNLMIKDLGLSPKEAALIGDEVVLAFRNYKAELEEALRTEYPNICDVTLKQLKQLQLHFKLSDEDVEAVMNLCLLEMKGAVLSQEDKKSLRTVLLALGGVTVAGAVASIAIPALSLPSAALVSYSIMSSLATHFRERRKDKEHLVDKADEKLKRKT